MPDDGMSLWDLESGEQLRHFPTSSNQTEIAFTQDNQTAFLQHDGLTQLDLATGEHLLTIGSLDTCCTDLVLHPNGEIVYTVTNKTTIIYEWDLETLELIREIGKAHGGIRTRLGITPDGKRLFSSSFSGTLFLWDLQSGDELYRMDSGEMIMDIDVGPDGMFGISPGAGNTAILWDLSLPVEVNDVKLWIAENRFVRELSCEERATYSIAPLCQSESP
jgi:WD40 repeat protein